MKILITGGAKRVGKMFTEHLSSKGHSIAIHYNSSNAEADELLAQIGGTASGHFTVQANLSSLEEAESLISSLCKEWSRPDLVINNASTYYRRGMSNFSNAELMDDYKVNFFSPLIIMREFRRICRKGRIINIVDRRVNFVDPDAGPYALAKKSLRDATLACAQEWAPDMKVNAIAPGPVLLPGETPKEAKYKDLLEQILIKVDELTTGEESGSVFVVD